MTDPIADMLTQIRNALAVRKTEVILPHSKLKMLLAAALVKHGWLAAASAQDGKVGMALNLQLKYDPDGASAISGLRRVSKPGQRIYAKAKMIPRTVLGSGTAIVSTSRGLMSTAEARKAGLGGELICEVW